MPELPEVETVRRGLSRLVIDRRIQAVTHDTDKSFPNAPEDVKQFMLGATVTEARRRAKVLLIDLSSGYTLVIHLKMTGQLIYRSDKDAWGAGHPNDSLIGELPDRSTRVTITFDDGSHLYFNDQRKFGWVKLYPTVEVPNIDFMKRVGPEPLDDSLSHTEFVQRMRRHNNTTVKAALLDQTVIAGIGNIYADETLWGARIHPATRVQAVPDAQLATLLDEARYVLLLSLEKGGSTDKNYVNAEGKKGSYIEFARVFRREGQPCQRHPEVLVEKTRIAGRGTHTCPACQRLT